MEQFGYYRLQIMHHTISIKETVSEPYMLQVSKKKKKGQSMTRGKGGITGRDKSFPIFVKSTAVVTTEH